MNIVILRSGVAIRKYPIVYTVYIGYCGVVECFCCILVTLYDPQTLSIPSGKCLDTLNWSETPQTLSGYPKNPVYTIGDFLMITKDLKITMFIYIMSCAQNEQYYPGLENHELVRVSIGT